MLLLPLVVVASLGLVCAEHDNFSCPDEFEGFYPHLFNCDRYWHCLKGEATEKICGNGLGFDDIDATYTTENCADLTNVNCGNRTQLEPPISAPHCPRLYGTFADEEDCTAFYTCRDGISNRYSCAPGLAFDPRDRVCKWADQVTSCKKPSQDGEHENQFVCPKGGPAGVFTKHPHPEDCRQYFVCISGTPREYGCPLGTVFQVGDSGVDGKCADPADVQECTNYYGELHFNKQDLVRAGVDPEAVGAQVPGPNRARVVSRPNFKEVRILPEENDRQPFDVELRVQDLTLVQEKKSIENNPPKPKSRPIAPSVQNAFVHSNSRPARPRVSLQAQDSPTTTTSTSTTLSTSLVTEAASTLPPLVSFAPVILAEQEPSLPTGPVQIPKSSASELPAATGEKQPSKVKAGEEYYYYYYYYDDDNPETAAVADDVPDSA